MFWPGMNAQIADTVSSCEICLTHRNRNAKEPMIGHDIPTRPWQKVGMDLFELYAKDYLLIVDDYSGYFEINQLTSTKSNSVIKFCKQQFARHGISSEVVSDNGPQFSSAEFKAFSKSYEFEHTLVSPNYPQSNGRAEKAVQTAKLILKKAKEDKQDPYIALLNYRNTPRDGLPSPVQLLMSRRTKTQLPTSKKLLKPKTNKTIVKTLQKQTK
ncbi:uncharacterized protein K02A2.6-like [Anneissia japonica]|uniref:uncharacterized protein K02A2.6-like n=1 Tax=Anneissia japonica TaxID=1529436 RepID=UPI001425B5C9|nr:uncharacterized protein K02A2.6-like [Anneissia japonica]